MKQKNSRKFFYKRQVSIGDVRRDLTLRFDAILNYAQDVGRLDTYDLGVKEGGTWVARHVEIIVNFFPKLNDYIDLSTYCSGVSKVSALRNVELKVDDELAILVKTEWVHLDEENYKPISVPKWLLHYGDNLKDFVRKYIRFSTEDSFLNSNSWQIRETDFDLNNHVNNARLAEILETNPNRNKVKKIEFQFINACDGDVEYSWTKDYKCLEVKTQIQNILNAKIDY